MVEVKLAIVEWLDSARPTSECQYLSEYKPIHPISCISVGFLIHDGDVVKTLSPNMSSIENNNIQVSGIIHIPTRSILKITNLVEEG